MPVGVCVSLERVGRRFDPSWRLCIFGTGGSPVRSRLARLHRRTSSGASSNLCLVRQTSGRTTCAPRPIVNSCLPTWWVGSRECGPSPLVLLRDLVPILPDLCYVTSATWNMLRGIGYVHRLRGLCYVLYTLCPSAPLPSTSAMDLTSMTSQRWRRACESAGRARVECSW
jgi:hypothetical protein